MCALAGIVSVSAVTRDFCASSRIAGMKKLLAKLRLFFFAWLRQPKDEMDRRQDRSEIQPLFPPNK